MYIERTDIRLYADVKKVLLRYLDMGSDSRRIDPISKYINALTKKQVHDELVKLNQLFQDRHFNLEEKWQEHFAKIQHLVAEDLDRNQKLLLGSYFTHEYSVQASALFNPSIVIHPNQNDLMNGGVRFIMSLRATGEGHISSVTFQEGEISDKGEILLLTNSDQISSGEKTDSEGFYKVTFSEKSPLSSRLLFPYLKEERMGMEDVRMVYLKEENLYVGTYTAYDGFAIQPKFFSTTDFRSFDVCPFIGSAATNKGMALFPEKINGQYAMIGRQDGRGLSIMYSYDLRTWHKSYPLQDPERGWEMLQIGNNGSPIRTSEGWLLLTHGVGPMRRYTLSMTLLDLQDPAKIIGSLEEPFMEPNDEEREGYVPNVLYTCGMMLHKEILYIPYAMSDSAVSFAKVPVHQVLKMLK